MPAALLRQSRTGSGVPQIGARPGPRHKGYGGQRSYSALRIMQVARHGRVWALHAAPEVKRRMRGCHLFRARYHSGGPEWAGRSRRKPQVPELTPAVGRIRLQAAAARPTRPFPRNPRPRSRRCRLRAPPLQMARVRCSPGTRCRPFAGFQNVLCAVAVA